MAFRTTARVRFGDVDRAGIAYYPHVFRWFDVAAEELFRAAGLPWGTLFPEASIVGFHSLIPATSVSRLTILAVEWRDR